MTVLWDTVKYYDVTIRYYSHTMTSLENTGTILGKYWENTMITLWTDCHSTMIALCRWTLTMSTMTPSSTWQLWTTNTCFADVDAYTSHLCWNLVCRDVVERLDISERSPSFGYGKNFITGHGLGPDTFVQMAFQVTYFGLYGKSSTLQSLTKLIVDFILIRMDQAHV